MTAPAELVVPRQRSLVSAFMMVFALFVGAGGYVLTDLDQRGTFPADWQLPSLGSLVITGPWYVGVAAWFVLGLTAWGVTKWRLPYADPLILPVIFLLCGIGISMIHRLDQYDELHSAELQMMWLVGAVLMYVLVVVFLRDHRRLQRYTYLWFAAGLFLILMPMLPLIGKENHGARIWIGLGPFSFQPAEIAKIILSIAFAAYLVEKGDVLAQGGKKVLGVVLPRARDLGPILIAWGISLVILVFERDLGTTLLFFGLFVMMLYTATQRVSWAILGVLLVIVMGVLGYLMFDHVQTRFESWLNPFSDYDKNLQIISAQFGFASGGLFGTGWGNGRPYLTPLAKNDFISAAIGEELGLYGFFAMVVLFGIIVARLFRAALTATEPFGKLLAAGLGFVFALQVFVILGGVTRLLPLTGLTTPFVSQGGSSLIANFIMAGLMLTITHQVRRPREVLSTGGEYESLSGEATQALPALAGTSTPRPDPGLVHAQLTTQSRGRRPMNGPIRAVSVLVMIMFTAIMLNQTYSYVARTPSLIADPANRRVRDAAFGTDRGDILVGNTAVVASEPVDDRYRFQRTYSDGALYAPVTGYYSFLYGGSGLEQSYNQQLSGQSDAQFLDRIVDVATGKSPQGASLETTLDARAQKAAAEGLGNRPGAVVALDYTTGAVLALVTSPSYDPSELASHDLDSTEDAWKKLNDDESAPLSNRAAREIYPPGSTFKLVVSAAALESGMTPDSMVESPSSIQLPGSTSQLGNAGSCGGTEITLADALRVSCNTAFANLGGDLGADALREQAERFGFDSPHLAELNGVASKFPQDPDPAQTMMSSIGAFDVAASPLQMAMVGAGIANDGVVMDPYLVSSVRGPDLNVISRTSPRRLSVAMSRSNAQLLQDMMVNVVDGGTGRRAQINGVRVGGKTGTAVTGERTPYAWFVAWADDPTVAVAVFVQDAGVDGSDVSGGRYAAPVAKAVIESMR